MYDIIRAIHTLNGSLSDRKTISGTSRSQIGRPLHQQSKTICPQCDNNKYRDTNNFITINVICCDWCMMKNKNKKFIDESM